MRCLVIGDIHLNGIHFLSSYIKNPDDYIYKTLDNAVKYAKKHNIKHIIQLGDVFNEPSPKQSCQRRLLEYVESTRCSWSFLIGNHDIAETNKHSMMMSEFIGRKIPDQMQVYTKPTVTQIEGIGCCFLPWPHNKTLLKKPGLTFAHITLQGTRLDSGMILKKGVTVDKKMGQWYIGDVHSANKIGDWGRYVGTPYQKTFGESLPKGFCDVEARIVDGKLRVRDRFIVQKPPFELVNLIIDSDDDLTKIKPHNPNNLTLYKLRLTADYQLPRHFRVENPHIYAVEYQRTRQKQQFDTTRQAANGVIDFNNPLDGLETFLSERGLNKEQVQLGLTKAQKLMERV